MSAASWWQRLFRRKPAVVPNQTTADPKRPDLREFIYLDEVSLLSLLSSQNGEVTDSKSEQASEGSEASIDATAGVSPGVIAKAETTSRYQTNNSSTIQTSRKATAQSRFRDLHSIDGLRIVEPIVVGTPAKDIESLKKIDTLSELASEAELHRGKLVELRVKLAADPVFHLGTMVSEFTSMAEDYPEMFAAEGGLATLQEVQPINKILKRLLAGLVPIRAVAVDYVVVEIDEVKYLAHKQLIEGLKLKNQPLEIVGVTEQEAYWKDLRRVLFSEAEFTVLARISQSGLQESWTPVKLADLFTDVTPDLVEQINAAGRVPFSRASSKPVESAPDAKLAAALLHYVDSLLHEVSWSLEPDQEEAVAQRIAELKSRSATVSDQTSAFSLITSFVLELVGGELDSARALELRTAAREAVGLSLFPASSSLSHAAPTAPEPKEGDEPLLLDVEFVAIYW
ncbi:Uncharacterised protein [Mycobacteroides abscessus subsp. abscessus]|nr:Uncharacterised protein [Mycobacteroides abscessus subsp. abscessus]